MNEIVKFIGGRAVTDSMVIAENVGNPHASVIKLVRQNIKDIEEFGRVGFEIQPFNTPGGKQNREIAILNEPQATLLLAYMRNNEVVRTFKKKLVKAFFVMAEKLRDMERQAQPVIPQSLPEALRLAAELAEERDKLQQERTVLKPKADAEGRFNLNALHRASGGEPKNRPSRWLENEQTKKLIEELSRNSCLGFEPVRSVKGGMMPGTFAHELLAISYAGWISPAFQLKVNQVFLDYRTGKLQPNPANMTRLQLLELALKSEQERLASEEEKRRLEAEAKIMKPKADAMDRIAISEGGMCRN